MDRGNVSSRTANLLVTAAVFAHGGSVAVANTSVSYSTIHRARTKNRNEVATKIRTNFSCELPITVHWDGIILPALNSYQKIDRIAIVVSSVNIEQLIAIPAIVRGTGQNICDVIVSTLKEWKLEDQISCLSFDTTSTNTGMRNGVCTLLEKEFKKEFLHLACRHHILEIVLAEAFRSIFGDSSAPEILIFNRFRQKWDKIDKTKYRTAKTSRYKQKFTGTKAQELLEFLTNHENKVQVRNDYAELLSLTKIFLGGIPRKGIKFYVPAGTSKARWMSRLIYSFKIYMFGSIRASDATFQITKKEETGFLKLLLFAIEGGYIQAWFSAPNAPSAPRNDIIFLKQLMDYRKKNRVVANNAIKKFLGHLWYVSETLVGLAFFDDTTTVQEKRKMVLKMKNTSRDTSNRLVVDLRKLNKMDMSLNSFVTKRTLRFFEILKLSVDFLEKDPIHWSNDENFMYSKNIVRKLRVVNDTAERSIALVKNLNKNLTTEEQKFQHLLQVVAKNRKQVSKMNKNEILSFLENE